MKTHQEILSNFQVAYDNQYDKSLEPTELDIRKEKIENLADTIEKNLITDKNQYLVIIRDFINQMITEGVDDEITDDLFAVIEQSLERPFAHRHNPINRFISYAFRWTAEQFAIRIYNDEKADI